MSCKYLHDDRAPRRCDPPILCRPPSGPPVTLGLAWGTYEVETQTAHGVSRSRPAPDMPRMNQPVPALRRFMVAIGLVATTLACGALCPAHALDIGPKSLPLTIAGVPVEIPVVGSLDVRTDAAAIALKASATGDLQSIQDHALAIARACAFRATIALTRASTSSSTALTRRRSLRSIQARLSTCRGMRPSGFARRYWEPL